MKTLQSLNDVVPEKKLVIAREITKMFEEVIRATPGEALAYLEENKEHQKGEFVLIVY
jgi:16S rRNA (cytidine1402-2'-O)-methyltransferase